MTDEPADDLDTPEDPRPVAGPRRNHLRPAEQRQFAAALRRMQSPEVTQAMDGVRRMLAEGPAGQLGRQISAQINAPIIAALRESGLFAWQQEIAASIVRSSGIGATLQPMAAAIARQASVVIDMSDMLPNYQRLLAHIAPKIDMAWFAELFRRHQPANWNDAVDGDEIHTMDLLDLAREGWPTTWVPGAVTLRALVLADAEDRAEVLIAHRDHVLDDCLSSLVEIDEGPHTERARLLEQAVGCIRAGAPGPAQAMAANIIDTAIRATMSPWKGYQKWLSVHPDDTDFTIGQLRYVATMAPVRPAVDSFHDGDPIPAAFNRHATSHAAGAIQYTDLNALVGVLLAVSITREFHQQHRDADASSEPA